MQAGFSLYRHRLDGLPGELALWLLALVVALPLAVCGSTASQLLRHQQPVRDTPLAKVLRPTSRQGFLSPSQRSIRRRISLESASEGTTGSVETQLPTSCHNRSTHRMTASGRVSYSVRHRAAYLLGEEAPDLSFLGALFRSRCCLYYQAYLKPQSPT